MNKIYTHPGQTEMQVEVILSSGTGTGAPPIYTIRMRYPRIIHGEILTHRLFSRNARSSRAVPVKTMLNEVRNTPFVPWHWGKNQAGMQANEECNELLHIEVGGTHFDNVSREEAWHYVRDANVKIAKAFMVAGYHKQIPNRLLEPFSWIDTLITSTNWSNFLWLRDHKDAEPHLQDLARLVNIALKNGSPEEPLPAVFQLLQPGEWHLPYINWAVDPQKVAAHLQKGKHSEWYPTKNQLVEHLCKISAARCARISYKPFDGDTSYDREIERYDMLVKADRVHASPLEHQATPDISLAYSDSDIEELDFMNIDVERVHWEKPYLHGNLTGWIQARKLVPNEAY